MMVTVFVSSALDDLYGIKAENDESGHPHPQLQLVLVLVLVSLGPVDRLSRLAAAADQRAEQVAVEPRDGLERNAFGADRGALADVGAAAEALLVVLGDHVDHP